MTLKVIVSINKHKEEVLDQEDCVNQYTILFQIVQHSK
jgi:hypothetical protein